MLTPWSICIVKQRTYECWLQHAQEDDGGDEAHHAVAAAGKNRSTWGIQQNVSRAGSNTYHRTSRRARRPLQTLPNTSQTQSLQTQRTEHTHAVTHDSTDDSTHALIHAYPPHPPHALPLTAAAGTWPGCSPSRPHRD